MCDLRQDHWLPRLTYKKLISLYLGFRFLAWYGILYVTCMVDGMRLELVWNEFPKFPNQKIAAHNLFLRKKSLKPVPQCLWFAWLLLLLDCLLWLDCNLLHRNVARIHQVLPHFPAHCKIHVWSSSEEHCNILLSEKLSKLWPFIHGLPLPVLEPLTLPCDQSQWSFDQRSKEQKFSDVLIPWWDLLSI